VAEQRPALLLTLVIVLGVFARQVGVVPEHVAGVGVAGELAALLVEVR